jgi:aldose 1-epimerase
MSRPFSGEQIDLRHGDHHAVVVEVGAGLRRYELGERKVLDGYGIAELPAGSRGQVLVPWPNRVRDGRYEWEGRTLQLDITEVANHNAIHGLLVWSNWTVAERDAARVVMAHDLHPSPGYPFDLRLEMTYELDDGGLTLTATAVNEGDSECPFGFGFHPYIAAPGAEVIDECEVKLPADSVQLVDEQMIPYAHEPVAGTAFDFRVPRPIGQTVLDHCFLGLSRDSDQLARATIAGPAGTTTLWSDAACSYLQVYSGDTLVPALRRRGLALEPMSCPPNAFASGEGLVRLAPGERYVGRCGISPA